MNGELTEKARRWGMWCHLSGLSWLLIGWIIPIPFLGLLVPFLVWRNTRELHPFVDAQGKEALNFQLSMALYTVAIGILFTFLFFLSCGVLLSNSSSYGGEIFGLIGLVLAGVAGVFVISQIVIVISAAIRAYRGESYRYPLTLRFLR